MISSFLAQIAVICLLTHGYLCCTPAPSPCGLVTTVSRHSWRSFDATCKQPAATAAESPTGLNIYGLEETCSVPHEESFRTEVQACDVPNVTVGNFQSLTVPNRPIILDGVDQSTAEEITYKCEDGDLRAYRGHQLLDNDVERIDCHVYLQSSNCELDIPDLFPIPTTVLFDGIMFSVPANVCQRNGFNLPLVINGNENPAASGTPNVDTVWSCRNTQLMVNGAPPFADVMDANSVACPTDCVVNLDASVTEGLAVPIGSCGVGTVGPAVCVFDETAGITQPATSFCPTGQYAVFSVGTVPSTSMNDVATGDAMTLGCAAQFPGIGVPFGTFTDVSDAVGTFTQAGITSIACSPAALNQG